MNGSVREWNEQTDAVNAANAKAGMNKRRVRAAVAKA